MEIQETKCAGYSANNPSRPQLTVNKSANQLRPQAELVTELYREMEQTRVEDPV